MASFAVFLVCQAKFKTDEGITEEKTWRDNYIYRYMYTCYCYVYIIHNSFSFCVFMCMLSEWEVAASCLSCSGHLMVKYFA